jgi:lipopolysaccharide biosynthesis regulator YciM
LLNRADLPAVERDRARNGLAQDYMKAGLFDRAEEAWKALEGSAFDTEARLALLTLHERSRDWRAAVDDAVKLERGSGTGSYASRIAHYWCELALEADAKGQTDDAREALRKAREAAPHAARPIVMAGERARRAGDHRLAVDHWRQLLAAHPHAFALVARDYADSARQAGDAEVALGELQTLYERAASLDLLAAIGMLDDSPPAQLERMARHLAAHPTLSAARELIRLRVVARGVSEDDSVKAIESAIEHAAKPLQRYRCAACGFEAQNYFWQCPGCLSWDSYPAQRLEDL